MTTLKIKGLSAAASSALEDHIRPMWDDQNARRLAVVELEHIARTQPGPASDAAPRVEVRIAQLEVPSGQTQDLIRVVLRSLYLLRTARGTLDEASGEVNLATESAKIADAVHSLFATEAAEARSVLHALLDMLDATQGMPDKGKAARRTRKLVAAGRAFLGTGDRELLASLAQEELDLSPVEVDVEASTAQETRVARETLESLGSTEPPGGPVRVGTVIEDVVPDLPRDLVKPATADPFTEGPMAKDAVSGSEQEGTTPTRTKRRKPAAKTAEPAGSAS